MPGKVCQYEIEQSCANWYYEYISNEKTLSKDICPLRSEQKHVALELQ